MALREIVSSYWSCFQALLFPQLEETIGALGQRHQHLVMVLEWVRVETLLPYPQRRRGCPQSDRQALARAFIAKACPELDPGMNSGGAACVCATELVEVHAKSLPPA